MNGERILQRYIGRVRAAGNLWQYERKNTAGRAHELWSDSALRLRSCRYGRDGDSTLAWISAIRKDQTADRGQADVIQWDPKFEVVKVNPLLNWTKKDVWAFVMKHDVPYNPLHDQNYPSIGCWPCTRAVQAGEDDRAGRWAGKVKKECGLHVIEQQDGGGI